MAMMKPPQPKKMPRPVSGTEVATPKYPPPSRASRSRSPTRNTKSQGAAKKVLVRPSSKAVPPRPTPGISPLQKSIPSGPSPLALVSEVPCETSTGLRPPPPPMCTFQDSRRSPLPGPPPVQDPPPHALRKPASSVTTLALPAPSPESGAIVPWAPAGDGQILVDVDQEGLAIGEMLQDSTFLQAMQVIQGHLADVLKATGQSNGGPVRVNVHVDLSGGSGPPAICGPSPYDTPSFPQPAIADSGHGQYYSGSGSWVDALPPTMAAERVVDAAEIRFCQRSMKRRFQDGELQELIRALSAGRINPMTADFLKLTVVEKMDENGKRALFSKDNRRLYCLKEYQKRCGFKPVPVRVRILAWQDVMEACMFRRNYDTETDGHEIFLR
ncbi:Uncharacterized protein SCF082_LOCUS1914 [Durusdinium trenchii]|uniref:Uncharacterized protein n=1 Tax=Durusdinium trenchii TaxID=1381693 RepID=A0ABP0HIS6_9DINO